MLAKEPKQYEASDTAFVDQGQSENDAATAPLSQSVLMKGASSCTLSSLRLTRQVTVFDRDSRMTGIRESSRVAGRI